MVTTSLGISNAVHLAPGAAVEFTVSWDWGAETFNDWMPCNAWSDDGVDGVYPEYYLTVLSSLAQTPFGGPILISKSIRNDDPSRYNTTFQVAAVKISV